MMNGKERVKKIFQLAQKPLDAILIKNGPEQFIDINFFYITGLTQGLFESSGLVLFPDGSIHVITTELESVIVENPSSDVHIYESKDHMGSILKKLLDMSKTIGIHTYGLLYADYQWISSLLPKKTFIDVSEAFQKSRIIKDVNEIKNIRKSCAIADRVMEDVVSYVKKNMTEDELASEIDYHLQRYGAKYPAFETISSFGPNTALPHYSHDTTRLQEGDFILCDFGASYNKYNSDTTRTFVFGSATEKQKHIYETVKKAQQQALDMICADIPANKVHDHVHTFIDATDFNGCFIHSTGHSLGLSVHDPGISFSSTCEKHLKENMVLTVEPGIYLKGFGGVRIEDDIIVTKDGCELLTKTTRLLQEL